MDHYLVSVQYSAIYKIFYILLSVNLQSRPCEVDAIILTRGTRELELPPVT